MTHRITLTLVALAGAAIAGPAENAKFIAKYMDDQTLAVARVDLSRFDVAASVKVLGDRGRFGPEERKQFREKLVPTVKTFIEKLDAAGANEIYSVMSLADLPNGGPSLIVRVRKGGSAARVAQCLDELGVGPTRRRIGREAIFCGREATFKRLSANGDQGDVALLTKAFTAAGDHTAQLLYLPNPDTVRVLREMIRRLPPELGGVSGRALTDGLQWAAIGVSSPPKMAVQVVVQSKDKAAATELREFLDAAVKLIASQPPTRKEVPNFEKLALILLPAVRGNRLVLEIRPGDARLKEVLAAVARPVRDARINARRHQSMNNLKQLALAMHNFHDRYGGFPPTAGYDAAGKPLLSWRVYVLPYLGHTELYKQFHLDEPWDGPHNKKLIARMPAAFATPGAKLKPGHATYLGAVNEKTVFTGERDGVRLRDVTDGSSNTVMIVEVDPDRAVVWSKPDDLKVDLKTPKKGVGNAWPGGFHVALCDGSVRFIAKAIAEETWKRLLTRNGGEPVKE